MTPLAAKYGSGRIDWNNPGIYQHIGYPSVVQMPDGTIVASYHEWSDDEAAAIRALHAISASPTEAVPADRRTAAHSVILRDEHGYCAHPHLIPAANGDLLVVCNWAPRRPFVLHPPEDPLYLNLLLRSPDEGRDLARTGRGASLRLERGRVRRPDRPLVGRE